MTSASQIGVYCIEAGMPSLMCDFRAQMLTTTCTREATSMPKSAPATTCTGVWPIISRSGL
eukprot:scaffold2636_cov340-Pavlova_lutheri.AAC.76